MDPRSGDADPKMTTTTRYFSTLWPIARGLGAAADAGVGA